MPEAPEVEIMNQEIDADFKGKQLLNYNILKGITITQLPLRLPPLHSALG